MSDDKPADIDCQVFRSNRKDQTYLYLPTGKTFDELPEVLARQFGEPEFVMDLVLHPGLSLSREDVATVMANIRSQGFHLQMPPNIHPDSCKTSK